MYRVYKSAWHDALLSTFIAEAKLEFAEIDAHLKGGHHLAFIRWKDAQIRISANYNLQNNVPVVNIRLESVLMINRMLT